MTGDKQPLQLQGEIRKKKAKSIKDCVWKVSVCESVHITFHERYGCVGWERESKEEKEEEDGEGN